MAPGPSCRAHRSDVRPSCLTLYWRTGSSPVARKIVAACLLSTLALPTFAQRSTPPPPPPPPQRGAPPPTPSPTPSPLRTPDVIFLPSDDAVVDAMLKLANVRKGDVVYDLGCGDGKIVIAAAKKYGARGVGIDIDP